MSKLNILLIEADYLLSKTYSECLRNDGYRVRTVSNVQEAVDEVDRIKPDLIILELQQKSHNGFEFLYELRSYVEWQDIPVIINTVIPAHALGINTMVMEEMGVSAYLYKPTTTLSGLLYTVDRCLVNVVG